MALNVSQGLVVIAAVVGDQLVGQAAALEGLVLDECNMIELFFLMGLRLLP